MKNLKFSSDQVQNIIDGQYYKTWRLFDDKDLNVDDQLQLIDSNSGQIFGFAVIEKITIKKIKDINDDDRLGHKPYSDLESILKDFYKYYGSTVSQETIVKVIEYKYVQKLVENNVEKNTTNINEIKIFTDGGSRGNPGPSAAAFVILDMQDSVVKTDGEYLGITTNNQAEYQAVRRALEAASQMRCSTAHVFMDSLLVVNQMNGIFKIRNRDLWPIHQEIIELAKKFKKVTYTHVPREMNKLADQKVNDILDSVKKNIDTNLL